MSGPEPRIEAIVCDVGGVLTSPLLEAFQRYEEHSGIPLKELGQAMAGVGAQDGVNPLFELETGRWSAAQFTDALAEHLSLQLGRPVSMADFGEVYFSHLRPNTAMIGFMSQLRARGYRMAVCTNNVREWQPLWRPRLKVDEIFEHVIDSGFVGTRKPEPEIFQITLDALGVPADAALLIDDTELNCTAAQAMGMSAVRFQSNEQTFTDVELLLA